MRDDKQKLAAATWLTYPVGSSLGEEMQADGGEAYLEIMRIKVGMYLDGGNSLWQLVVTDPGTKESHHVGTLRDSWVQTDQCL